MINVTLMTYYNFEGEREKKKEILFRDKDSVRFIYIFIYHLTFMQVLDHACFKNDNLESGEITYTLIIIKYSYYKQ